MRQIGSLRSRWGRLESRHRISRFQMGPTDIPGMHEAVSVASTISFSLRTVVFPPPNRVR